MPLTKCAEVRRAFRLLRDSKKIVKETAVLGRRESHQECHYGQPIRIWKFAWVVLWLLLSFYLHAALRNAKCSHHSDRLLPALTVLSFRGVFIEISAFSALSRPAQGCCIRKALRIGGTSVYWWRFEQEPGARLLLGRDRAGYLTH